MMCARCVVLGSSLFGEQMCHALDDDDDDDVNDAARQTNKSTRFLLRVW